VINNFINRADNIQVNRQTLAETLTAYFLNGASNHE
jgi:hypothetical protein